MKKRFVLIVATIFLLGGLVACGSTADTSTQPGTEGNDVSEVTATLTPIPSPDPTATPEPTPTPDPTPTPEPTLPPSPTPTPIPTPIPTPTAAPIKSSVSKEDAVVGQYVSFGSYEQDNDTSNGKEGIEWLVLDVQGDKALLLSRLCLDSMGFQNDFDRQDTTWSTSYIRMWLNNEFYKAAFDSNQSALVVKSKIKTAKNEGTGTIGGADTEDKVFLLSIEELLKYFPDSEAVEVDYYITKTTNYRNSAFAAPASQYAIGLGQDYETRTDNEFYGYCGWWTRSMGLNHYHAAYVGANGYLSTVGDNIWAEFMDEDEAEVVTPNYGVRPAIWVKLQ